ncbi:MAG TPA: AAA domain-containing protein [Gammaproteobacteria bacterium]|nr:AAA domain-containing protein [Gammaproteobacteria bacterium]
MSDAWKLGDKAASALGLPTLNAVASKTDKNIAFAYGNACQFTEQTLRQREPKVDSATYRYRQRHLTQALATLRSQLGNRAPGHDLDTPQQAEAWLKALQQWSVVSAALEEQTATEQLHLAAAPAILKFWIELSRLEDLSAYANAEGARTLALSKLHEGPPDLGDCTEALLMLCRRVSGKSDYPWVPVAGVWLERHDDGPLGPIDPQIIIVPDEFFDPQTNEPRRDMDEDAIKRWMELDPGESGADARDEALQPDDEQSQTVETEAASLYDWATFWARWNEVTNQEFDRDDGLAGLTEVLYGAGGPALHVRVVDRRKLMPSGHAKRLAEAISLNDYPLLSHALDQLRGKGEQSQSVSLGSLECSAFVGHMDSCEDGKRKSAFPLDPTQRLAAMAVSSRPFTGGGHLLPVNGPPGTGKTSFLRAALASMWVRSALNQEDHPKVVYGVAATNQAVSNMIEAFGAIRGTAPGGADFPWLPDLTSYGWFYPSQAAAEERVDLMQLVWDSGAKNPLTPAAQAAGFAGRSHEALRATLLSRAAEVFNCAAHDLSVEEARDRAWKHLEGLRKQLERRQKAGSQALEAAAARWLAARGQSRICHRQGCDHYTLSAIEDKLSTETDALDHALRVLERTIHADKHLNTGWRSWLPGQIRRWLWRRGITDLETLKATCNEALAPLQRDCPSDLPSMEALAFELGERHRQKRVELTRIRQQLSTSASRIDQAEQALKALRDAVEALLDLTGMSPTGPFRAGRRELVRQLCRWIRQGHPESGPAYDALIHALEAPLDTQFRVEMFHWAARYWECRWILAAENGPPNNDRERVQRLMMLGVIIVATTHKVLKLGEYCTADLLVMDEAGQCRPEVAGACLTLAREAAFVGDVYQLQPVVNLPKGMQDRVAQRVAPDETLPDAVKPEQGSGMWLARAATGFHTQDEHDEADEPGVTLLYHYRCMPSIIGYCNELLYGGRIRDARGAPRPAHLDWLPQMSWVGVSGYPQQQGQSWVNPEEVRQIVGWIIASYDRLTLIKGDNGQQRRLALRDVVAIVTPLAKQAAVIRTALEARLGKSEVDGMVIGTVHKLQGTERPVVLFSLVQNINTNPTLMADRDGGMLMNVAVSRARDAFVIFADRKTLRPAPADARSDPTPLSQAPVASLGRYMRSTGTRLFPSVLVVVEAPGKRRAIEQALGLDVAVVATGGHLRTATLEDAGLRWSSSPKEWLQSLHEHVGLVRELVIATDDDLAGELIGLHAAEDATSLFANWTADKSSVRVRRMRFSDMTAQTLRTAYAGAGERFDAQRLAAALVREFANLVDKRLFQAHGLPLSNYASAQVRDAVGWLHEASRRGPSYEVRCEIVTDDDDLMTGFVVNGQGAVAPPGYFGRSEAEALTQRLRKDRRLEPVALRTVLQQPGLYPANTTPRVLALGVDELGLDVDTVQANLNALYLQGVEPAEEDVSDG